VQLTHETDTPTWLSFTVDRALHRAVIMLHVLPVGDEASDRIRGWIRDVATLGDLAAAVDKNLPAAGKLLAPLLEGAPASNGSGGGVGAGARAT
jgi:hypothetical protein